MIVGEEVIKRADYVVYCDSCGSFDVGVYEKGIVFKKKVVTCENCGKAVKNDQESQESNPRNYGKHEVARARAELGKKYKRSYFRVSTSKTLERQENIYKTPIKLSDWNTKEVSFEESTEESKP